MSSTPHAPNGLRRWRFGAGRIKPYLETAPYLIVVNSCMGEAGRGKIKYYYATESVGLAAGLLITVHNAGPFTHTPSPMGFLNTVLRDQPTCSISWSDFLQRMCVLTFPNGLAAESVS